MQELFEGTILTFEEIAQRTGVSPSTICRYAQSGGWRRPPGAHRKTLPDWREVSPARLKGYPLARRVRYLAERLVEQMESDPAIDPYDLAWALEMLEMAKGEDRPRCGLSLKSRARRAAKRLIEAMERDPNADPHDLAWALEMLKESPPRTAEEGRRPRGARDPASSP